MKRPPSLAWLIVLFCTGSLAFGVPSSGRSAFFAGEDIYLGGLAVTDGWPMRANLILADKRSTVWDHRTICALVGDENRRFLQGATVRISDHEKIKLVQHDGQAEKLLFYGANGRSERIWLLGEFHPFDRGYRREGELFLKKKSLIGSGRATEDERIGLLFLRQKAPGGG